MKPEPNWKNFMNQSSQGLPVPTVVDGVAGPHLLQGSLCQEGHRGRAGLPEYARELGCNRDSARPVVGTRCLRQLVNSRLGPHNQLI
jgi:hypothetical protein